MYIFYGADRELWRLSHDHPPLDEFILIANPLSPWSFSKKSEDFLPSNFKDVHLFSMSNLITKSKLYSLILQRVFHIFNSKCSTTLLMKSYSIQYIWNDDSDITECFLRVRFRENLFFIFFLKIFFSFFPDRPTLHFKRLATRN